MSRPGNARARRVRSMTADDLDAVARLLMRDDLCARRGVKRRLTALLATSPSHCLVAESRERVIGAALGTVKDL